MEVAPLPPLCVPPLPETGANRTYEPTMRIDKPDRALARFGHASTPPRGAAPIARIPTHDCIEPSPISAPALRLGEPGWLQHAVAWYVRFAPVSRKGVRTEGGAVRELRARLRGQIPNSGRYTGPRPARLRAETARPRSPSRRGGRTGVATACALTFAFASEAEACRAFGIDAVAEPDGRASHGVVVVHRPADEGRVSARVQTRGDSPANAAARACGA